MMKTLAATLTLIAALSSIPTTTHATETHSPDRPQSVSMPAEGVRLLARMNGVSTARQRDMLARQERQNQAYAELQRRGLRYDGAFFTPAGQLVVQADGKTPAATAARAAGLQIRTPRLGEKRLHDLVERLGRQTPSGVVSIVPDITHDRVVVGVRSAGELPRVRETLADHGPSITTVVDTEASAHIARTSTNTPSSVVKSGDKINVGSGYCSAGFPVTTSEGKPAMAWVGHCITGQTSFAHDGVVFSRDAEAVYTRGSTTRDMGIVRFASGSTMSKAVNTYGTSLIASATRGVLKAPENTQACKSGVETGITCGRIGGYGSTLVYGGDTKVTGLGVSTICSEEGDSGGAIVADGYAVGMVSGGRGHAKCGFNAGHVDARVSYFQPLSDVMDHYDLTYGQATAPGRQHHGAEVRTGR